MTDTTPDPAPQGAPYPEHFKQALILDDAQVIGAFLDETTYTLAEWVQFDGYHEQRLVPVRKSFQQVLAEYFEIDLAKIEAEKRAMLDAHREYTGRSIPGTAGGAS